LAPDDPDWWVVVVKTVVWWAVMSAAFYGCVKAVGWETAFAVEQPTTQS
jgi:hypothetical protein